MEARTDPVVLRSEYEADELLVEDEVQEEEEEEEEEEDFIGDTDDLYGDDDMQASSYTRAGPKKKKKPGATAPTARPRPSAARQPSPARPSASASQATSSSAPTSASSTKKTQAQSQGLQQKKGRGYLKPAHLVYQRFKWDPKLSRLLDYCHIGYLDRFDGVLETPYLTFLTIEEDEGVPFHRIRYFKIWDRVVWDREARLDLLSSGAWEASVAPFIRATLREKPAAAVSEQLYEQQGSGRKKAVIFACGSFCPVHKQHIHMLEMAKRHLEQKRGYEVLSAVLSPTADGMLKKKFWTKDGFLSAKEPNPPGFISAHHRARLIELTAEGRSWIKPDLWAAQRNAPAAKAQEHVREVFNPQTIHTETAPEVEVISVFGADTLQRVGNFKNKTSSMLCVVNRKYDFDSEEVFYQKMKGVPAATATESAAHFIDLVLADDYEDSDDNDDGDYNGLTKFSQVDASATLVREAFLGGDPDVERQVAQRLLTAAAWNYIRKHHLLPPRPVGSHSMTIQDLAVGVLPGLSVGKEIRWDELRFTKRIGKGISSDAFAMVYKDQPVAVKVFYFSNSAREPPKRTLKSLFNEIHALRKLDHENVIKYVGTGATADKVFIVLELATCGCLANFLSSSSGYRSLLASSESTSADLGEESALPEYDSAERWQWSALRRWGQQHDMTVILKVLADVAHGMAHIHERGIIHRDLSVDNVLVSTTASHSSLAQNTDLVAKIADFGVCQMLSEEEREKRERDYDQVLHVRQEQRRGRRPSADASSEQEDNNADEDEKKDSVQRQRLDTEPHASGNHLITVRGNMRLYAPEATDDGHFYSFPADVFMFGMLVYEVLEGRQAYEGSSTQAAIKRKMKGQRPEVSAEHRALYPDLVALMEACWAHDPRLRPAFAAVAQRLSEMLTRTTAEVQK